MTVLLSPHRTSAGVDVLRARRLTNQMVLVEPGAFLRHHHGLGCSLSPCVDHLRDRIRICENQVHKLSTYKKLNNAKV